jgi:MIP family channel proteins
MTPADHVAANPSHEDPSKIPLARKAAAEFVGTYFLTLVGAGIEIVAVLKPGQIDRSVKAAGPGLVVAAMIYAVGDVSGAHFNPAVTCAFAVRRAFGWRHVPVYLIMQIGAAIAAALTLRSLFGTVGDVGANHLETVTAGKGLVIEALFTGLLVVVILNAAHKHSLVGTQAALAVGATITVCGLVGGELTTMSMNPARSVGPALVSGHATDLWVYLAGPTIGALAAVAVVAIIRPHRNLDEFQAAEGEDGAARGLPARAD